MPKASPLTKRVIFNPRDVTIALLRSQNISEGLWNLSMDLDAGFMNLRAEGRVAPTIYARVLRVCLQRVEERQANELTINAAQVNPPRIIVPN